MSTSRKSKPELKQKSLNNWFSKTPTERPGQIPPLTSRNSQKEPKTPDSKLNAPKTRVLTSSDGSRDLPPSSDPVSIDVDMEELEDEPIRRITVGRPKRKIIHEDSDQEEGSQQTQKKTTTARQGTLTNVKAHRLSKKQRTGKVFSDDDEVEGERQKLDAFTQKLSKYKKSPAKATSSRKSNSNHGSDDVFVLPSDSESEATSIKSGFSLARPVSSTVELRRNSTSDTDTSVELGGEDDEDGPGPKKSGSKTETSRRPVKAVPNGKGAENGPESFLTAAEQRQMGKKNEKKSTENPYIFLSEDSLKDKDGNRPDSAKYDPRTLYIPKKAWAEFTPFEKQFWEIKQNHYDTVLFFQKGKFLELYEEDARIGHREFDLKLTSRVKMSMVGVPEYSFSFWAAKFLGKGYKVGRVDQAETALGAEMRQAADKSKGKASADKQKEKIVRRELNKVYTNGTLVDPELLQDDQAGHCIAIYEESVDNIMNKFGVCVLDCATSQFQLSAFEDDICHTKLETLMRQLRPKEVLLRKDNLSILTTRVLKSVLPASCLWTTLRDVEGFSYDKTIQELNKMYSEGENGDDVDEANKILEVGVPQSIREMVSSNGAMISLGSMIWYLRQLNIDKNIMSMKNFNVYDPMKQGEGLVLDGQTLAHVEVLQNNEGTEDGSLLQLLSRCVTPFGKRLFRIWLCMPLKRVSDINDRLDAVKEIQDHTTFNEKFIGIAKGLPDLERIVSRIHAKNCKVKDFIKVLNAFRKMNDGLKDLEDHSSGFESKIIQGLLRSAPDLIKNIENIENMFEKPGSDKDDELTPRAGKDEEYDAIMDEIDEIEQKLDGELKMFNKKLKSSATYWHSGIGNKEIYLVQTKPDEKGIPSNWIKHGGTKTATRWIVPSLQGDIRKLKEARENRGTATKQFKFRLFEEFDTDRATWLRAVRVLAELDCLFSLAKASSSLGEPACRPEFVEADSAFVEFEELRHPALINVNFIPNNVKLGENTAKIALLTGPNMGGKSTLMRMTAVGVIMAQLGMLVPAKRARLCPVDSILTRMGAYDNMFSNASTFKVELDECCKILRDATPKSLVILDELGRGTSTFDGMAIASAVLHQLATHTLPLAFFATHYGSLTDDFAYHPNIKNMHMATMVDDEKRELVFLYKLVEGVAKGSFGTHVASLAGVPAEVVKRAEVISADFAEKFRASMAQRRERESTHRLPLVAQADFAFLFAIASGVRQISGDEVKGREVLVRMRETAKRYLQ